MFASNHLLLQFYFFIFKLTYILHILLFHCNFQYPHGTRGFQIALSDARVPVLEKLRL